LSIVPVVGDRDAFELTRIVEAERVPLELDGTTLYLGVRQLIVVEDGQIRTESYSYRLQTGTAMSSWLIRWEYRRAPADNVYPRGHVHVNSSFPDGAPVGHLHIPAPPMGLGLIVRHLITDWNVEPRTDDWEAILQDSAADFDYPSH
jgi:hypothetical protein